MEVQRNGMAMAGGTASVKALSRAVDGVAATPRVAVVRHIEQARRTRPDATPREICDALDRRYLAAVTSTGAAAGAASAAPGVSTPAGLALAAGDAVGFIAASGLLALAYAEIYGVPIDDLERRRTLILAVMLGDSGSATVSKMAERTGAHWGRVVVSSIPIESIREINKILGRNFVTKYGTKQGILVLGKAVPFGIGAAIGAGGNLGFGYLTTKAARRAFGPPPPTWSVVEPPLSPICGTATLNASMGETAVPSTEPLSSSEDSTAPST